MGVNEWEASGLETPPGTCASSHGGTQQTFPAGEKNT